MNKNEILSKAEVARVEPRGKRDYPLHVIQVEINGIPHVICDCYAVPGLGSNEAVAKLVLESLQKGIVKLTEERKAPENPKPEISTA